MTIYKWLLRTVATLSVGFAQQYTITNLAGGGPPPSPIPALSTGIGNVWGTTVRSNGDIYLCNGHAIFRLGLDSMLYLVAGSGYTGFTGDGGPAIGADLALNTFSGSSNNNRSDQIGMVVDANGNLLFADAANYRVRKVSPTGTISTVAGTGRPGSSGDNGLAINADIEAPLGMALNKEGDLYFSVGSQIRKVSPQGVITTFAGSTTRGFSGDGGRAVEALFDRIWDIAIDGNGNMLVADTGNLRVRRISSQGIVTTIAGTGIQGLSGDGGPASDAQLFQPGSLALDSNGTWFVADGGRIRKVTRDGTISAVAQIGARGLAIGSDNRLIIASEQRIHQLDLQSGLWSTLAGNGMVPGYYGGDGGPAISANLNAGGQLAPDLLGNLYIADSGNNRVRVIRPSGIIETVVGTGVAGFSGDGGLAMNAQVSAPTGVTVDLEGNLWIADRGNHRIRKLSKAGMITTEAGTGVSSFSGDGGLAIEAGFSGPIALATDRAGNILVSDSGNGRIRRLSLDGKVTTVAGNGSVRMNSDYSTSVRPALTSAIGVGSGIAAAPDGSIYFSESGGTGGSDPRATNSVRKVTPDGMLVQVVGGLAQFEGPSGDGGQAQNARVGPVSGVVVDSIGNLFFGDSGRIRRIGVDGIITTVAGGGTDTTRGYSGPATNVLSLGGPSSIDKHGNLYLRRSVPLGFSAFGSNWISVLQPQASILLSGVRNAASNVAGSVCPGEIVVVLGSGIGPARLTQSVLDAAGFVPTSLAGTQIFFNDIPAPILYTSYDQVAVVVPYSVSGTSTAIIVKFAGQSSAPRTVSLATTAPALFTLDSSGIGQAAAINQDGSINARRVPARIGEVIVLYATGEGQSAPIGVDGKPATAPLPRPSLPVSATIGSQPGIVRYAGGAPGLVAGLMQVNVEIPDGIQTGETVPVTIQVGAVRSQAGVTISVAGR